MKISNLCNEILTYIVTASKSLGNKDKQYSPSGNLKSGTTLKTYSKEVTYCPRKAGGTGKAGGRHAGPPPMIKYKATITHTIKSNESIPSAYTASVTEDRIKSDWNTFKNTYVTTMLKTDEVVTVSAVLTLLYLVRCFMDSRFKLFTDTYHDSYVWLYDTSTPSNYNSYYKVDTSLTINSEIEDIKTIVDIFVDEITDRRSLHVLKTISSVSKTEVAV